MELRHLQSFVAIVEDGSLSAASRRCGLSQPALSQQVQSLEDELGEPLLIRRPRGVETTPAGALLHDHARRVLAAAESLRLAFHNRQELHSGSVSLGVIPTIAPYLLPSLLAPFRRAYPGVVISVMEGKTSELIAATVSGAIEFAILSDVGPEERKRWSLHVTELFREPLLLAAPENHPLACQENLPTPADLVPAELIHLSGGHCLADRTFRLCRLRDPNPNLRCDQLATALAMVAAGMGVSVVPKLATRAGPPPGVAFRPFNDHRLDRVISLMKRRGTRPSIATAELLKLFRTTRSADAH